jgi:RNA polymerase sigma-70 factor, ECF subfamily
MDERRRPPGHPRRDLARPIGASDGDEAQGGLAADLARDLDASFDRFVEQFQDRLFGFVLTLTGNRSEAEEIAQDAFVSAYRALQGYDPDRRRSLSLRAWLFTIALNKVRNRARRPAPLTLDDGFVLAANVADGPEARAEQNEAVAVVRQALDGLAPRYRMPVVLRHIEGLSYDEIAHVLKQPVGTAKANVHRGLALLRNSDKIGALS